jgi:hypothetical protein
MFRIFSKIWLLNMVLVALIVFFGTMSFDVWSQGDETIPGPKSGKNAERLPPGKEIIERFMPPDSTYGMVAEKNLFSSSRTEVLPVKGNAGPPKIAQQPIFLYGVVLAGDRKQALISNPESGPDAGKKGNRGKWIKAGDTLGSFTVSDIRKDRIILTEGANTHEILLFDPNKPPRQIMAPSSSAPAVAARDATVTGSKTVFGTPSASGTTEASAEALGARKPGTEAPSSIAADGKNAPAGEYKIINTPFGPVKRRTP